MDLLNSDIKELLKQLEEYLNNVDKATLDKVKEELKELEDKIDKTLNKT